MAIGLSRLRRRRSTTRAQFIGPIALVAIFLKATLSHASKTVAIGPCFRKKRKAWGRRCAGNHWVAHSNQRALLGATNQFCFLLFICYSILIKTWWLSGRDMCWSHQRPGFKPQVWQISMLFFNIRSYATLTSRTTTFHHHLTIHASSESRSRSQN